jgi:endonuclease/exonuclease/phosphatase family metal-dependent hydrolase
MASAKSVRPLMVMAAGLTAVLIAWFSFATARPRPPAPTRIAPVTPPLKVITYNVQFLPGPGRLFNKRSDPRYRAETIGRRLSEYDIIGLQEAFDNEPRTLLLDELRHRLGDDFHCVVPPDSERSSFGISSGLSIITRLPIIASHSMRYGNDSSVWRYGPQADGFAAKGALHARIRLSGNFPGEQSVDVFVTHLESHEPAAREAQYSLFAQFVRTHTEAGRPALLLGDFNTDGRLAFRKDPASAYNRMIAALSLGRAHAPLIDVWPNLSDKPGGTNDQETAEGGERIDYIFLFQHADARPALSPTAIHVRRFADPSVTFLSDHSGVEAIFNWTPSRP